MFKQLIYINFILVVLAEKDCYYAFLEPEPRDVPCGASVDCKGPNSTCIFSLNKAQRICCQHKEGTTLPECPKGYTSHDLTMPIMCQPHGEYLGVCPEQYECVKSHAIYTIDFDILGPQDNYMCCKKL